MIPADFRHVLTSSVTIIPREYQTWGYDTTSLNVIEGYLHSGLWKDQDSTFQDIDGIVAQGKIYAKCFQGWV